jgi:hypothetical protein
MRTSNPIVNITSGLLADGKKYSGERAATDRIFAATITFPAYDQLGLGDCKVAVGKMFSINVGMAAPALVLLFAAKRGDL